MKTKNNKKTNSVEKFREKLFKTTGELYSEIENLERDFVFPIFEPTKKIKNKSKINQLKIIHDSQKKSPHILDLKKKQEQAREEWVENPQQTKISQSKFIQNFEAPDIDELPKPKYKFNHPQKIKRKSNIKLNFSNNFLNQSQTIKKPIKIKKQHQSTNFFIKISKTIIDILISPFKFLDFMVDCFLKGVWFCVKNFFLGIYKILELFILNLITLFKFFLRQPLKISSINFTYKKTNYKPILSFIIICLIIILPLQILNLKEKTTIIKGEVLGKSIEGLNMLKNASISGKNFDFEQATQHFNQASLNFGVAQTYLKNLDIFSQQIIKLVPQANQADNLLMIGKLSALVGADLTTLAQELSTQPETQNLNLITKFSTIQKTLENIEPSFFELISRIKKIDIKLLKKYLDEKNLAQVKLLISSTKALENKFNNFKQLTNFILEFLGKNSTKNYLIIFQNNNELRPTGGFMGSYALIEIKNGKIIKMNIPGGGFYDLKAATQKIVEAPKPFHLFSPYWQIWNANWFPDWPSSAKKISSFYEQSINGTTVDGVITITPDVIEDLLKIIGPIEMPAYQKTITSENFVRELQKAVEFEYDKQENKPKKIIADLMPIILNSVFNIKVETAPQLLTLLNNNLKKKNILFWFTDEKLEKTIKKFNWAGEIKNSSKDYLMVIHTNIGGGKTDRVISNTINHNVEINKNGEIFDTVTLTKKHNGEKGDVFEDHNNVDYVRFYVPQGSTLISAENFQKMPTNLFKTPANQKILAKDKDLISIEKKPILDERFDIRITQEFNKTCFGGWFLINTGKEKIVTLKYKLPFKLKKQKRTFRQKLFRKKNNNKIYYSLISQKQPGLNSTDFTSTVHLPKDIELINTVSKNNLEKNNSKIIYKDNLETDGYYSLELN